MERASKSSYSDRLMILGIVLLVAGPVAYWVISPSSWSYSAALEKQKNGDFEAAEREYLQILKSKPNHPLVLLRLGELAYRKQEFETALTFADKALTIAYPQQKPSIINLKTNSLIALNRPEDAVKSIWQLHEFTSLPKDFQKLESEQLLPFMTSPGNRHFLNSVAYVMAINNVELARAEKFISTVIRFFERDSNQARFAIPYFYERAGMHEKAYQRLAELTKEVQGDDNGNLLQMVGISLEIKTILAKSQNNPSATDAKRLRVLESAGNYSTLFIAYNRMKLLAEKLGNGEAEKYLREMNRFRTDYVNEENCRLEIDDRKMLQQGFELQHYYDTRAIVRLRLGDAWAAKPIVQADEDKFPDFKRSGRIANASYERGYRDLIKSIEVKAAMDAYREKFPENSLMISLPSDHLASQRDENRTKAIEHYHRFLLLVSLGRLDDAEVFYGKVQDLGFEPGPLLF